MDGTECNYQGFTISMRHIADKWIRDSFRRIGTKSHTNEFMILMKNRMVWYGWDSCMRVWGMQHLTPLIYFDYFLVRNLWVIIIIKNLPRRYIFTMKKVRHLWIIIIIRKWRWKWNLWVVGISKRRHHPQQQQQQQTTSLADVNPVWYHFDRNVRTIEWFSLFIIKTALDRNRRVVFTNTIFFLQVPFSLPTYSKPKKIEHY